MSVLLPQPLGSGRFQSSAVLGSITSAGVTLVYEFTAGVAADGLFALTRVWELPWLWSIGLPSRLSNGCLGARGELGFAVLSLSLTFELGAMGATAPVFIDRGLRRLASGSPGTLPLTLPPPVELVRARETIVLNSRSISSIFVWNTSFIQRLPCGVLKCIPSRDVQSRAAALGLLLTRLRVISFHRVTLLFMKSATGVPTSGFCGIVHSTTKPGRFFSFNSIIRQNSRGSHLISGVTGTLETSLVPSIITNVSIWSFPWNSLILMTWATETPPKDRTVVWPLTKISFRSLTRLSPATKWRLPGWFALLPMVGF